MENPSAQQILKAGKDNPGDQVKKGDILVILETDKASMEVPAEQDGTLNIVKNKGEKVTVGEVIGFIDTSSSGIQISESMSRESPSYNKDKKEGSVQESSGKAGLSQEDHNLNQKDSFVGIQNTKENLSPSVRRLVEMNQINPSEIVGTGQGGRLTKEDILTALKQGSTSNEKQRYTKSHLPYLEQSPALNGKGGAKTRKIRGSKRKNHNKKRSKAGGYDKPQEKDSSKACAIPTFNSYLKHL